MRIDELRNGLADERNRIAAADPTEGRHETDRRVRRHRLQRTGLAVVVVALLIGAGIVLASRGTDEQRVISGPGELPYYLPDPLPGGTITLDEYPLPTGAPRQSTQTVVFTSDTSAFPSADSPVLLVLVITPDQPLAPTATQLNVGPISSSAYWTDDRDAYSVIARGVGESAFRAAVASVSVQPNGQVSAVPPDGFREVLREEFPGGSSTPGGISSVIGKTGYALSFDEHPSSASSLIQGPILTVSSWPRSHAWALMSQALEPTEVRGRPGYLERMTGVSQPSGVVLIWWEREDVMVTVTGISEDDARRFADSLREIDAEEWEQFAAQHRALEADGSGPATVVQGGPTATPTTVP